MGITKKSSEGELVTYDSVTGGYRSEVVIVDRDGNEASAGRGGGAGSDRELVVTTYFVKTAFSGASVGNTITSTQIIDVTSTPTTVSTIWRNQTTASDLGSVPSAANLTLIGSNALTNAQLRASSVATTELLPRSSFYPNYGAPDDSTSAQSGIDEIGNLKTRSAVLTDEGTFRVNFPDTTLDFSIGNVTVSGDIVTGVGFSGYDVHYKDYFKINSDSESNYTQVVEVISDTTLRLAASYPGASSGAASRSLVKPVQANGGTYVISAGKAVLSSGTTSGGSVIFGRNVDYLPLIYRTVLSISQRIANQEIRIGFTEAANPARWLARFNASGTSNTQIVCETGRNPTGAPSGTDLQKTTINLPTGLTTEDDVDYRIELFTEVVYFYINGVKVAEHSTVIPTSFDVMNAGVRILNTGIAASSTDVSVSYITVKNHNVIQVSAMSESESLVAKATPGIVFSNLVATSNNTNLLTLDCSQISGVLLQFSAPVAWNNVTIYFQATNYLDDLGWTNIEGYNPSTGENASYANISNQAFYLPSYGYKYIRVRVTSYTSGTIRLDAHALERPIPYSATTVKSLTNITTKFREAFEAYTPGLKWTETKASNDIIAIDGNSAAASYLVISKDPLVAGTTSKIESSVNFQLPIELSLGMSLSQRTLGQEFSAEIVDTTTPTATISNIAISAIQQATTTLTVTTATPHNLKVGYRIGIKEVSDSRMNYPALVVATTPSATQFTVTAGPGGTIPSVTAGPFASGFVFYRTAMQGAQNGTSVIFENATVTNASFYVRNEAGDVLPGGTIAGNHSTTIGTTASVQAINAAYNYSFQPTTEFRAAIQADRLQWHDSVVDGLAGTTARYTRTQVCPNHTSYYKLRFRAYSSDSLTVPTAQIVSIAKTGTTTATIVFDVAHNLTTASQIILYGVRDQTNFPNLLTATSIASVVNSTSITVIIGGAVTATSYGGFVAKVQGGNLGSALGYNAIVASNATLTSGVLTVVGNASWTGLLIGDYVNLVGFRNATNGGTLSVDGAWRIRNIVTTTLELEAIGNTVVPADFVLTNCGGGVIKRTDLRISFARIFDYDRERVEILGRPLTDQTASIPVNIQNTPNIGTVSTVTAVTGAGLNAGVFVNDIASAALTTTTTTAAVTQGNAQSAEFNIQVTAVSGGTPTLDVGIEESDDSGTSWYRIYDFPRITTSGSYRTPLLRLTGNRIRYVQTVTGTTPSFTRSLNRLSYSVAGERYRQIFDRTVVPNTLNSTTAALNSDGSGVVNMVVSMGAIITTAPQFVLEGSEDGSSWYVIGANLTGVASSTVSQTYATVHSKFLRARVAVAGSGATLNYVNLKSS